jgi:hypothetical protein
VAERTLAKTSHSRKKLPRKKVRIANKKKCFFNMLKTSSWAIIKKIKKTSL